MLLSHSREELCSKCEPAAQESPRKPHPSSTTTALTTGAFHSRSRHETETVQFKEQQQIAQKNNSNKSLPTQHIWTENAFENSCEGGAGKNKLHHAAGADAEGSCFLTHTKDFRGKQCGTDWLNSADWLLITVFATSKIPAGTGYK